MYNYKWNLKDAAFTKDKGTVFSCFACGGGSSMGYKLAGFDVVGCNEIDKRMADLYSRNLSPEYCFLEPIQEFVGRESFPERLYGLDILDGSPPCSTFSIAGSREKAWGVEKVFREGQAAQVLDTLFFDFIELAKRLQPKVVVAENVKGLLLGNAKSYVRRIYEGFLDAGYYVNHYLLDASKMGVPQKCERVFFVCIRKDLAHHVKCEHDLFGITPLLDLDFNCPPVPFSGCYDGKGEEVVSKELRKMWEGRKPGDNDLRDAARRIYGKEKLFSHKYAYMDKVCRTLTTHKGGIIHFDKPLYLSRGEVVSISSFPQDYDFGTQSPHYVCGMSVPPVMMAQVAERIYYQWLDKIKSNKNNMEDLNKNDN